MTDEEVATMVVILNTSWNFTIEIAARMMIAQTVAIPPHRFFMKP
jgi:hypothetical protein